MDQFTAAGVHFGYTRTDECDLRPLSLRPASELCTGDVVAVNKYLERLSDVEKVSRPAIPGRTVHLHIGPSCLDYAMARPDENFPVYNR